MNSSHQGRGGGGGGWEDAFKSSTDLTPRIRTHLRSVYTLLALLCLTAAFGTWLELRGALPFAGGGLLSTALSIGSVVAVTSMRPQPSNYNIRSGLLASASFLQGANVGPLISQMFYFHPYTASTTLLTALGSASLIFASLSMAALRTERRSMLFLGGILASAVSILMWVGMINVFFGGGLLGNIELFGGLAVFIGYVLFDTQLIIHRAETSPDVDDIQDALHLFMDFFAIFVRLLIILQRSQERRDREEDERRGGPSSRRSRLR